MLRDIHELLASVELRRQQPAALVAHQEGGRASEGVGLDRLGLGRDLDAAERRAPHVAKVRDRVGQLRKVAEAEVAWGAVRAVRRELLRPDDDDLADAHCSRGTQQLAKVLLLRHVVQHKD